MTTRRALSGLAGLLVAATSLAACGGDDRTPGGGPPPSPVAGHVSPSAGASRSAALHGTLTLDGTPVDAEFVGARVMRNGLSAVCQDEVAQAVRGQYEVHVASEADVRGCGAGDAEVLLWFYRDGFVFSVETMPWPGEGATAEFDAHFSSANAAGASDPVTQFKGHLLDREGTQLPAGTVVEAFIGDVLCGITSLRFGGATEGYYTLEVAGPQTIPGCNADATITFRLDGSPAVETATNDLGRGRDPRADLDLTLR